MVFQFFNHTVEDLKQDADTVHDELSPQQSSQKRKSITRPKTGSKQNDGERFPASSINDLDDTIPMKSEPAEHKPRRISLAEDKSHEVKLTKSAPESYLCFPATPEGNNEEIFEGPEELGEEIFVYGEKHPMWNFASKQFGDTPYSNGQDVRFDEVLSLIEIRFGESVEDENELSKLQALAVTRGCQTDVDTHLPRRTPKPRARRRSSALIEVIGDDESKGE